MSTIGFCGYGGEALSTCRLPHALLLFTSRTPHNNGVVMQYRYPKAAPSISRDFPSSCASTRRRRLRLQPKSKEAVFCDDKPLTSEEVQQILSRYGSVEEDSLGIIQTNPSSPLATMSGDTDDSSAVTSRLSEFLILILGSTALSIGMGEMLTKYEFFQDWRYLWPLIGVLYMWDGISSSQGARPLFIGNSSRWMQYTAVAAGLGLVIGGAYDAFMPVWMTGPNIVTNAGIGQDSAMVLLLLSAGSFVQPSSFREYNPTRLLLEITLLAELYKLGESSIDELLSNFVAIWTNLIS